MTKNKLYRCPAWLYIQYWILGKTTHQMGKACETDNKRILYWMKKFGIKRKTPSEVRVGHLVTQETRKKISESLKGKRSRNWKGGRYLDRYGYIMKLCPAHPCSDEKGYVKEHRLVIENFLKDFLEPKNVVHHRNGIKHDNRLSNLMLFKDESEHLKHHWEIGTYDFFKKSSKSEVLFD